MTSSLNNIPGCRINKIPVINRHYVNCNTIAQGIAQGIAHRIAHRIAPPHYCTIRRTNPHYRILSYQTQHTVHHTPHIVLSQSANNTLYTLHYTLHTYTLHPTLHTTHGTPYSVRRRTPDTTHYITHTTHRTPHTAHHTLHTIFHTLHPTLHTTHRT